MTQFSQTGSLEHKPQNDTRLSDFMAEVREFGRDEASGKDALPKLAISVCRAVYEGYLEAGKDTDGADGATRVYHAYVKAKTNKQIHDRSDAGLKANISKLRQIITFAGKGAAGAWDAVDVFNRAFTIRADHEKDDIAVKPAYAAFVDVAREQLKFDVALTDGQIGETIMATTKAKEVTVIGQIEKAKKILDDLITGESKAGKDQSAEIVQAQEFLGQRLAALMTTKAQAEALEKALAAGWVMGEDGTLRMAA